LPQKFHEKIIENKPPTESIGEKGKIVGEKRPFPLY